MVTELESRLDAAKMKYALQTYRVSANDLRESLTKWNVGSVDPAGDLREMIVSLYPDSDEPYRLMEYLMNEGIDALAKSSETPDVYGALFQNGEE